MVIEKGLEKNKVVRTGVAFEPELLEKFDYWIKENSFPNRSEAVRFIIREKLSKENLRKDKTKKVIGTLTYIFNHHSFDSSSKLIEMQHRTENIIVSTMHAHVSEHLCLETIILSGKCSDVEFFAEETLALKGVLSGQLYMVSEEEF